MRAHETDAESELACMHACLALAERDPETASEVLCWLCWLRKMAHWAINKESPGEAVALADPY